MVNLSLTKEEFHVLHNLFLHELHRRDCSLPECTWGEPSGCPTCSLDKKFYEKYMELENGNLS